MRGLAAVCTLLLFSSVSSQNDLQEELAARVEQFVQGTAYSSECGNIHRQATSKQPLPLALARQSKFALGCNFLSLASTGFLERLKTATDGSLATKCLPSP